MFHFPSDLLFVSLTSCNRDRFLNMLKLESRIVPKQERAQQRIAQILLSTESLLAAGTKVTSSAIAEHAGIPVGSIYRYFPNVFSIYRTLFEKLNGELRARIFMVMQNADDEKTWELLFEEILAQAIDLYQQHPAYGNLLQMMTDPALQNIRQECIDATSRIFADRWRAGKDGFHGGDIDHVAQTASKLFTVIEQGYFEQQRGGSDGLLFFEMVKALRAYLALYLLP